MHVSDPPRYSTPADRRRGVIGSSRHGFSEGSAPATHRRRLRSAKSLGCTTSNHFNLVNNSFDGAGARSVLAERDVSNVELRLPAGEGINIQMRVQEATNSAGGSVARLVRAAGWVLMARRLATERRGTGARVLLETYGRRCRVDDISNVRAALPKSVRACELIVATQSRRRAVNAPHLVALVHAGRQVLAVARHLFARGGYPARHLAVCPAVEREA
jgi:hypothetical protein